MNILVVDDDQDTLALLTMLLERQGWQVDAHSTLTDARRALSHSAYDVLVADLHLPDGNGLSLAGVGRVRGAILVTGGEDEEQRRASLAMGWNRCLTKPVAGAEVIAAIKQILGRAATDP